jgi:hypothetical protein
MILKPLILFEPSLRMQLVPSRREHSGVQRRGAAEEGDALLPQLCPQLVDGSPCLHHTSPTTCITTGSVGTATRRTSTASSTAASRLLLISAQATTATTPLTQTHPSTTITKQANSNGMLCSSLPTLFCKRSARAVQLHLELLRHRLA